VAQWRRAQGRLSDAPLSDWPALRAANARDASARVPFAVNGLQVGSVARAHLQALRAWPQWLRVDEAGVELHVDVRQLSPVLAQLNGTLQAMGMIRAWRDEAFALFDPASGVRLATLERAAARFWGTLTLGAHANGYVTDAGGRPTHLWIAQRSATKATDPGLFDNRWLVFPQDFPSANFLRSHAMDSALLVQAQPDQPQSDLAHVLLRWQQAGLPLRVVTPAPGAAPQPLSVRRPRLFRWMWHRALASLGLRRNSAGGFGAVVPMPSSSSG